MKPDYGNVSTYTLQRMVNDHWKSILDPTTTDAVRLMASQELEKIEAELARRGI